MIISADHNKNDEIADDGVAMKTKQAAVHVMLKVGWLLFGNNLDKMIISSDHNIKKGEMADGVAMKRVNKVMLKGCRPPFVLIFLFGSYLDQFQEC